MEFCFQSGIKNLLIFQEVRNEEYFSYHVFLQVFLWKLKPAEKFSPKAAKFSFRVQIRRKSYEFFRKKPLIHISLLGTWNPRLPSLTKSSHRRQTFFCSNSEKQKFQFFFTEILLRKCSSGHLEGIFDQPSKILCEKSTKVSFKLRNVRDANFFYSVPSFQNNPPNREKAVPTNIFFKKNIVKKPRIFRFGLQNPMQL